MIYKISTLFLFCLNISAVNFSIIGPCSDKPVFNTQVKATSISVGKLTENILIENKIQFLGSDYGVSQIFNSPIGTDAMEILSDTKMRAHGWCYSVDGNIPELLMNEVILDGQEKNITWFMGYSTYVGNMQTGEHEWVGQCEPSYELEQTPFPNYCK
jgi:hypothetical protein